MPLRPNKRVNRSFESHFLLPAYSLARYVPQYQPSAYERNQCLLNCTLPSSHPFAIAALSIEYSPLTWYAAIGTSKLSRAARTISRYGSPGLIITISAPSSISSAISRSASAHSVHPFDSYADPRTVGVGIRCFAKWAVKRRRIFCAVCQNRNLGEPVRIERRANRFNAPIHHNPRAQSHLLPPVRRLFALSTSSSPSRRYRFLPAHSRFRNARDRGIRNFCTDPQSPSLGNLFFNRTNRSRMIHWDCN